MRIANEGLAYTNIGCLNNSIRKQSMFIWAVIRSHLPETCALIDSQIARDCVYFLSLLGILPLLYVSCSLFHLFQTAVHLMNKPVYGQRLNPGNGNTITVNIRNTSLKGGLEAKAEALCVCPLLNLLFKCMLLLTKLP